MFKFKFDDLHKFLLKMMCDINLSLEKYSQSGLLDIKKEQY